MYDRSGTEEEYSEREQLLQEVKDIMDEMDNIRVTTNKRKHAAVEKDKELGHEIRKQAMERLSVDNNKGIYNLIFSIISSKTYNSIH